MTRVNSAFGLRHARAGTAIGFETSARTRDSWARLLRPCCQAMTEESPYLVKSTLDRLVAGLSHERQVRHWLTSAQQCSQPSAGIWLLEAARLGKPLTLKPWSGCHGRQTRASFCAAWMALGMPTPSCPT